MAEIVRSGRGLPTGKPPAGKELHCNGCGTVSKTTNNEPSARPDYFDEGMGGKRPGWYIKCPGEGCNEEVFLDYR